MEAQLAAFTEQREIVFVMLARLAMVAGKRTEQASSRIYVQGGDVSRARTMCFKVHVR
jgi:hypothetical protein